MESPRPLSKDTEPSVPSRALARARQQLGMASLPVDADWPGLLELTRTLYPHDDVARPEYMRWEYEQNPTGGAAAQIGRKEKIVIGHYAVIPLPYCIAGRQVTGSLSVNTMTHPDFRGRGVFMVLAHDVFQLCYQKHYEFTLGFPNPNSHQGFLRHLAFQEIGEVPLWTLPLHLKSLQAAPQLRAKHVTTLMLGGLGPFWKGWLGWLRRRWQTHSAVREIQTLDSVADSIWDASKTQCANILVRDARYLRWRFQEHPTRRYRLFTAGATPDSTGYLVTRVMDVQGIRCGMLVDLLVPPTPAGAQSARDLVFHALKMFDADKIALAGGLALNNTVPAQAFRSAGLVQCPAPLLPQRFPVIVRWNGQESPNPSLFQLKNWYLMMGDYDAV